MVTIDPAIAGAGSPTTGRTIYDNYTYTLHVIITSSNYLSVITGSKLSILSSSLSFTYSSIDWWLYKYSVIVSWDIILTSSG